MELNRYGEQNHPKFRTRRLYSANGHWYFDTREGEQVGPYRNKNEAEKALAVFVAKSLLELKENRPDNHSIHYGTQDDIVHKIEELLDYFAYQKNKGQTAALAWAAYRLKNLLSNKINITNSQERMEVIKYALDNEL